MKRVRLTVNNPTPVDLTVDVTKLDDHQMPVGDIPVGPVTKSSTKTVPEFKVNKDGGYTVTANLNSGPQEFQQSNSVIGQSDPVVATVNLAVNGNSIPADGSELKKLFDKMGDDKGFAPRSIGDALNTVLGSLIVYQPPVPPKTEPTILLRLTPQEFSSVMSLNNFSYMQPDDSTDSKVTSNTTTDLASSVPVYGSLAANFAAGTMYEVHAELKGYGWVGKQEEPTWDLSAAIDKLTDNQKKSMCMAMKEPNAILMYIDQVYALELAQFNVQEMKTLKAGAKASGLSVISGDVAYDFSDSATKNFSVENIALNFSGVTPPSSAVPCDAWAHSQSAHIHIESQYPKPPASAKRLTLPASIIDGLKNAAK
jgi:hypothetical protein